MRMAEADTVSYVSQGRRPYQQDRNASALVPIPNDGLAVVAAVFDGHGASDTGHVVSQALSQTFVPALSNALEAGADVPAALESAVDDMEKEAQRLSLEQRTYHGSTLCATVLMPGRKSLVTANVGDSRAVLASGPADAALRATQLTRDHVPTDPGERKRIEAAGGWVTENKMLNGYIGMSRAIGDNDLKGHRNRVRFHNRPSANTASFAEDLLIATPDVRSIALSPEDHFYIVASDGLWHVMTNEEAVATGWKALKAGRDPSKVLVRAALRRGAGDNISVLVTPISDDASRLLELLNKSNELDFSFSRIFLRKRGRIPVEAAKPIATIGSDPRARDIPVGAPESAARLVPGATASAREPSEKDDRRSWVTRLARRIRRKTKRPAPVNEQGAVDDESIHGGHAVWVAAEDYDMMVHGPRAMHGPAEPLDTGPGIDNADEKAVIEDEDSGTDANPWAESHEDLTLANIHAFMR